MKTPLHRMHTLLLALLLTLCPLTASAQQTLPAAPENTFSIVLIPDTQAYRDSAADPAQVTNPIFENHANWIAANLEKHRIAFVSHVGDIVDINEIQQWEVARKCMDTFHGKVPAGISVGNHDMTSAGDSSLFQQYFGAQRYSEFPWYGGCFPAQHSPAGHSGNNSNSFQLFSACGIDMIFLHLECNAPDDVLAWANALLQKYKNRPAFITSHMGWGPESKPTEADQYFTAPKGRMRWTKIHEGRGNSPQQMWEKCYQHHPNLVAVFSGDQSRTQALRAQSAGTDGNIIHEFLQDYGSGWLRLYRCSPATGGIEAITFHPATEELCQETKIVPDKAQHQFSVHSATMARFFNTQSTKTAR